MAYCKLSQIDGKSATPVGVTHTLTVHDDRTWSLHVHGQEVKPSHCNAIINFPSKLSPDVVAVLLKKLDSLCVCAGNPDPRFVQLLKAKKGSIVSADGTPSAYIDSTTIELNGVKYSETVRTSKCQVIGKSAPKKK